MKFHPFRINILATALILFLSSMPAVAAKALNVQVSDDTEVPLYYYAAAKAKATGRVILWLPSEAGILPQEKKLARALAARGAEVWLADIHAGLFVARTASNLEKFSPAMIAKIIDHVVRKSNRQVVLLANSRGVIPLLRGAHHWQRHYQKTSAGKSKLAGAILLSPQFFEKTPEPGFEGKLRTIVQNTNMAIMIIQPDLSPFYWKLKQCIDALTRHGSDVMTWIVKGARDRFYYRPDATKFEEQKALRLPWMITRSMKVMMPYTRRKRIAKVIQPVAGKKKATVVKQARKLREYKAKFNTPALELKNLQGESSGLGKFRNQVVLVNFWASWCPPCVHEMPSMQKLQDRYKGKGFTILAVNMAETAATIKQFLKTKVSVRFPIVLDSDGAVLKRWRVFAFPTSYLLDRKGNIRYAVFGAIDWNTKDVFGKIEKLLREK